MIVDTAGRLGIDAEMMQQAADIRDAVQPDEILFVVDAMIGQDAVTTAEAFRDGVGFTGVVLTKLDGDARGGAALSVRQVTGEPILFASTGEKLETSTSSTRTGWPAGSSGMGDMLTLIEQAEQAFDAEQTAKTAAKLGTRRADPGGLPRADAGDPQDGADRQHPRHAARRGPDEGPAREVDDRHLDKLQAIIRGMTPGGAGRPEDHQRLPPAAHRQRLRASRSAT